jgi:hypothetical protein
MKSELNSSLGLANSTGILVKSTLVSGGYIITIKPMASGILVVPVDRAENVPVIIGKKYPIDTPIIMAMNIQRVRY